MPEPGTDALWLVLIPLITALVSFLLPTRGGTLAACAVVVAAWPLARLLHAVWHTGTVSQHLGGWQPPLGIQVSANGSDTFLLMIVWLIGLGVTIYAFHYFRKKSELFWPLWMFLWAGLNALIISDDLFNLYVTMELVGLAAVALTALTGRAEALRAAMRYTIISLTGSLLYLMGVAMTYAAYGSVDMETLSTTIKPHPAGYTALGLMTVGLIAKAALFPCHVWLPPAHANAPAPVSALLSALVIKGPFLILAQLWLQVYSKIVTPEAFAVISFLGGAAVLWGATQAIVQQRLKRLIAYSTVAQLGYLFLALPLTASHPDAWSGILILLAAHALAKTALFLAAGNVLHAAGHDTLAELKTIMPRLPVTAFAVALAGVSIIGLPPSGGFLGKWLLIVSALDRNALGIALLLVIGSLLAAIYIFRIIALAFSGEESTKGVRFHQPPRSMEWAAFVLAFFAVLLGLASNAPLHLISMGGRMAP